MTDTTTQSGTIVDVDPTTLTIALNVRTDTKLDPSFVASVKELGILQPPMVIINETGGYDVILGQRRTLAAVEAGLKTIPVYLVTKREAEAAQVVDQLVENDQRQALSNAERVGGYKSLSLFGMSIDQIAKTTKANKQTVTAALAVAGSEKATAAVAQFELDLEQAAKIAEFDDQPKVMAKLLETARNTPYNLDYRIREEKAKAELAASKKEASEKLRAARIATVKASDYPTYHRPSTEHPQARLSQLQTEAGKDLTVTAHKKCAGHAAFISAEAYAQKAEIVYVCTDYIAGGHTLRSSGPVLTAEQIAEKEAQDAERAAREQEIDITRDLRMTFLQQLLQRNKANTLPGADQLVAMAIGGTLYLEISRQTYWPGHDEILAELTGMPEAADLAGSQRSALLRAWADTHNQPALATLTVAIAAHEWAMRSPMGALAASKIVFLDTLVKWGHNPTELEQQVHAACTERVAAEAAIAAEEAAK